jgi:hypothetical protein
MKSHLNAAHFANEDVAIAYVEARLWPNGPVCPKCGTIGEATKSRGKTTRPGLWNCTPPPPEPELPLLGGGPNAATG